jgi:hypothetical protein
MRLDRLRPEPGSSFLRKKFLAFGRLIPGIACLVLLLHGTAASAAAGTSWACKKKLPNGECIGPSVMTEGGESTSGTRALVGSDQLVWLGKVTHYDRLGVRTECSYAPTGRCEGELNTYYPYGKRKTESVRIIDGEDQYFGVSTTIYPDGKRLDCVVNAAGDCDGETVVQLASKEILHGMRKAYGFESKWVGSGRWIFRNGEVKDCAVAEDGACRAGPLIFWDRDSKTVGTLGPNNLLTGSIAIYDRGGFRKSCISSMTGGCPTRDLQVTRAAPGAWQKPLPKKASTIRPREIRSALLRSATVVISPPPDSAEIRYQFLACGDDIHVAYTLVRASQARVPFGGMVWNGGELIGAFDDPGAARTAGNLSCASPQSRVVATLGKHQKDLIQHRFVDGSELWSLEEMIRNYLDRLSVKAFAVIGPEIAAPTPIPLTTSR